MITAYQQKLTNKKKTHFLLYCKVTSLNVYIHIKSVKACAM